jgi:hypothetical protein
MKTIKAKLGMSRAGMGSDSYMRMEIEDATSGIRFIELEIPMEAFAYLVSGLHGVEATATLRGIENVGMKHEQKTELIMTPDDIPYKEQDNPELVEEVLSEYEVDGWKAYVPDLFNFHKREDDYSSGTKETYQRVGFHRYVEDDDNAKN